MKLNWIYLLSVVILIGLSSCGDQDAVENEELEGDWTAISFNAQIESVSDFSGMEFTTNTVVLGSNFNYDLRFDASTFTTNGEYDLDIEVYINDLLNQTSSDTYTSVDGMGNYTIDGSIMTLDNSFYDFDFNGVSLDASNGSQSASYEINSAGELVFSQNEQVSSETNGALVTTTVVSSSTWVRK